ncbi:MAG: alkaline phosphatase family protein, partial [Phycisphaerales bacterium]
MTSRPVQRLLILGWDAADWQVIDPLLSRGRMPNLARLLAEGTRADLRTLEPKLSPLLWSTIATGKTADRHGILNFVE